MGSKTSKPFFGFVANALVFKKIKEALGLECARLCITGAAPITLDTLNYFGSIGIHIMEVYGMSENTGPQTCSQNAFFTAGSCGKCLPGRAVQA